MATIISHLKLIVPVIEEPPQELMDAFIKGCIRAAPKTYRHLKKALPDTKAVIKKLIKPSLKATESFLRPDYVTRRGLEIKDILTVSEAEIEFRARRWLKKTHLAFHKDPKERKREIEFKAVYYLKEMARLNLPFKGYKDIVRGVGPTGARWLTGDQTVLGRLGPGEILMGRPVDITRSGQASRCLRMRDAPYRSIGAARFRGRFIREILASGSKIIDADYRPSLLAQGNDKINRLVTGYARDKFVPFTPGGASHVDFMKEVTRLFLDILVSIP